jgi:hypothetical protein
VSPEGMDTARIEALKRKLAAREGKPQFEENCEALRTEIARLQSGAVDGPKDL